MVTRAQAPRRTQTPHFITAGAGQGEKDGTAEGVGGLWGVPSLPPSFPPGPQMPSLAPQVLCTLLCARCCFRSWKYPGDKPQSPAPRAHCQLLRWAASQSDDRAVEGQALGREGGLASRGLCSRWAGLAWPFPCPGVQSHLWGGQHSEPTPQLAMGPLGPPRQCPAAWSWANALSARSLGSLTSGSPSQQGRNEDPPRPSLQSAALSPQSTVRTCCRG